MIENFKPQTRAEAYWGAISGDYEGEIPKPQTTTECYLAAMSGNYDGELPTPHTRMHMLMRNAALALQSGEEPIIEYTYTTDPVAGGHIFSLSDIKSIIIPDGYTGIAAYAFNNRAFMESITLPDGITSIGNEAFSTCGSLTKINLPNSLTSIGEAVFNQCIALADITLPDSVTSIGNGAFMGCKSLKSITIPSGVQILGTVMFKNSGLETITINKPENSISGAPWGATNATVVWTG